MPIETLIKLLGIVGIIAIVYWVLLKLNLPQPAWIFFYIVAAIIGIYAIADLTGLSGGHSLLR